jgi:hypothetical protein
LLKAVKNHASGANAIIAVDFGPGKPVVGLFQSIARAATHTVNRMKTFAARISLLHGGANRKSLSFAPPF